MKTYVLIALGFYLFVATYCHPVPAEVSQTQVAGKESKTEVDSNGDCSASRHLKDGGWMTKGKIDFDKLIDLHREVVAPSRFPIVLAVFEKCKAKMVYEGKTDCEIAEQVLNCH